MTAARESTDAQWEAYYAAQAKAHTAKAAYNRALAAECRLHPHAAYQSKYRADAADYEVLAAECDRIAAELMGETA
jgi:hypothetical protein